MAHRELLARHRSVMPKWLALYYEQPIEIASAQGRRVTDREGRTYLDFFAGILTNAIGYDVAEISDAIRAQVDTGVLHTSTLYLIKSQVELAEKIAELSGIPDAKVFFTNSGTEANETALLLATQYRAQRAGARAAQLATTAGRSPPSAITGNRGWSASAPQPDQGAAGCTAATATAARSAICPTRTTPRPASPTCARSSKRRRPATSRA